MRSEVVERRGRGGNSTPVKPKQKNKGGTTSSTVKEKNEEATIDRKNLLERRGVVGPKNGIRSSLEKKRGVVDPSPVGRRVPINGLACREEKEKRQFPKNLRTKGKDHDTMGFDKASGEGGRLRGS